MNTPTTQRDKWYGKLFTKYAANAAIFLVLCVIAICVLAIDRFKTGEPISQETAKWGLIIFLILTTIASIIWTDIESGNDTK